MRVLLIDTGRSRGAANVETWRTQLGLVPQDDVALVSWLPPAEPLPVVDHMVFGPVLDCGRREPSRPAVGMPRRAPLPTAPSVWHLSRANPRRLSAALGRRGRRLFDAFTARLPFPLTAQLRSSSRLGKAIRRRLGISSDGVATDFAIAVGWSRHVVSLARWADVMVPIDPKSRKAAWVLTRRVKGPDAAIDINSGTRVIRDLRH